MSRFTLTIFDDARALLATEEQLEFKEYAAVQRAFDRWLKQGGMAIMADLKVVDVRTTTLELDFRKPEHSPAESRHERLTEGLPAQEPSAEV